MKEKLELWFIRSAIIDFQEGNALYLGVVYILIFGYIFKYSFILGILFAFMFSLITFKYNKFGRRYFYFAVCDLHKVKAKTLNLKFK